MRSFTPKIIAIASLLAAVPLSSAYAVHHSHFEVERGKASPPRDVLSLVKTTAGLHSCPKGVPPPVG
ncbi:hypothetical protein [Mesorhizobium carmichaelinearum]|uniref:hypothetical protein n=1 Tax=Mesorhizobium carmichaelinearum TaxID=1208188 RepID=UPI000BA2F272|nr:hypothetical protein [Mesorhizobium carmichaelinearum]